ncbi:MAG: hypothetical protein ACTSQE_08220 [Candidatus Heimdallarchaeaceae archaeon]
MEEKKLSESSAETMKDFSISWQMFKANYKAFLATELFAIISYIIIHACLFSILAFVYVAIPNLSFKRFIIGLFYRFNTSHVFVSIITGISYVVLIGFMNCQYGLAYDILSSGDMFAEFKSSFTYFKRHWWQYILLAFIIGISMFIPDRRIVFPLPSAINPPKGSPIFVIIFRTTQFILSWLFLVVFSNTLPSVTAQGNFINSFKESFAILKKYPIRLIRTWGVFFLIFQFPLMSTSIIFIALIPIIKGTIWIKILAGFILVLYLYVIFIGLPMMSLIATRIYNSVEFSRFNLNMRNLEFGSVEGERKISNAKS